MISVKYETASLCFFTYCINFPNANKTIKWISSLAAQLDDLTANNSLSLSPNRPKRVRLRARKNRACEVECSSGAYFDSNSDSNRLIAYENIGEEGELSIDLMVGDEISSLLGIHKYNNK